MNYPRVNLLLRALEEAIVVFQQRDDGNLHQESSREKVWQLYSI